MTGTDSAADGALTGLRVLEVGHIISGPFCGHLFADQGAEVIKVEPATGDAMRSWGGMYKGVGLYWPIIARGKKSVTLDLRTAEHQAVFRELARTADVVIENFRPGTMERWGIGPDDLRALNPDLIMVRITGYGQTGPMRDVAGFGSIAEAMSGFRHLSGEPGRPPVRVGISLGDALAGTQGFVGALLALLSGHLRPDRPRGQVVDVALYEAMWMYMESIVPEFAKLGEVRGPAGPLLPGIAPSSVYPTDDGRWIVMGANKDNVFARLAAVMDRPDWAGPDGSYATHVQRGHRQQELDAEIAAWTRTRSVEDLLHELERAGVPAGRIFTAPDILQDPHYRARDMVLEVATPDLGDETVPMPGVVPKLSLTPGRVVRGAPLLGEHNDEVLGAIHRALSPEPVGRS
ncbi:CoA transferase [Nocardioides endophyticus]|uniref:CoA transferase n=1 Tax=Nocardioides endophyticus TaxID=1353775 RepID=A0ABP8ZCL1_9ACTN